MRVRTSRREGMEFDAGAFAARVRCIRQRLPCLHRVVRDAAAAGNWSTDLFFVLGSVVLLFIQGYNAQAVTTEDQVVIAAEVMVASSRDFGRLEPMLRAGRRELESGRRRRATGGGARRRRLLAPPSR